MHDVYRAVYGGIIGKHLKDNSRKRNFFMIKCGIEEMKKHIFGVIIIFAYSNSLLVEHGSSNVNVRAAPGRISS